MLNSTELDLRDILSDDSTLVDNDELKELGKDYNFANLLDQRIYYLKTSRHESQFKNDPDSDIFEALEDAQRGLAIAKEKLKELTGLNL